MMEKKLSQFTVSDHLSSLAMIILAIFIVGGWVAESIFLYVVAGIFLIIFYTVSSDKIRDKLDYEK